MIPIRGGGNLIEAGAIGLFSEVLSVIVYYLPKSVDIVYSFGPQADEEKFSWGIIVQFISHTHQDTILKNASISLEKKEDFSQGTKDA